MCDVSASTPGSVHDLEHFRQSGAAQRIPEDVTAGGMLVTKDCTKNCRTIASLFPTKPDAIIP